MYHCNRNSCIESEENVEKSRPVKYCADICIQGLPVAYCDKTKYLGVMLRSSVKFSVDLSYYMPQNV